jgi:excisionase family DNA binding protein
VTQIGLPNKELLRVDEVAAFFSVTTRTVYLWIDHGHFQVEKTPGGLIRITLESVKKKRLMNQKD